MSRQGLKRFIATSLETMTKSGKSIPGQNKKNIFNRKRE
jgi:hypothetical protein